MRLRHADEAARFGFLHAGKDRIDPHAGIDEHWHGATPHGDAAHFSIKPHTETTWGGAPAHEQAEFDTYADWATWVAGL